MLLPRHFYFYFHFFTCYISMILHFALFIRLTDREQFMQLSSLFLLYYRLCRFQVQRLLLSFIVERKVQSIFLPVIHQDCRRFIRFKVRRKVLLCWIRRLWPENDIAFLHDPSEFYQRNSEIPAFNSFLNLSRIEDYRIILHEYSGLLKSFKEELWFGRV